VVAGHDHTAPEIARDRGPALGAASRAALARSRGRGGNVREEALGNVARDLGEHRTLPLARQLVGETSGNERAIGVAQDRTDARGRHPNTEEIGGDVLELMGFVENDGVVVGNHGARVRPAEREVREEQMMIDDDDAGRLGLALHAGDEAFGEVRATETDARVARRAHLLPDRFVFRKTRDLGNVTRRRATGPLLDEGERAPSAREQGIGARAVLAEPTQAEVIRKPLHQRGAHR
jgi:hypothetical protein